MTGAKKREDNKYRFIRWDVGYGPWLHYVTTKAGPHWLYPESGQRIGRFNVNVIWCSYGSRLEDQFIKKQPTPEDLY